MVSGPGTFQLFMPKTCDVEWFLFMEVVMSALRQCHLALMSSDTSYSHMTSESCQALHPHGPVLESLLLLCFSLVSDL